MSEITGYISVPFHGESAYEIAVKHGYTGTEEEWLKELTGLDKVAGRLHGYKWHVDTDKVFDENGNLCGSLEDCMTKDFIGSWFYVRTSTSEAGVVAYDDKYKIDGANGYLSLRDYVVWTGVHLVHISAFEAKSSNKKNADGKYSPKGGVDGLMSSTDKAYLSDLINTYWGTDKLTVFNNPDPAEGWQTNWLFDTGIYLGGIKKDCGGHPPVVNDNHTSWVVMVFNGMATDAESLNRNHRIQIAFDVVNSKIYMRRGWMSSKSWADAWSEVGGQVADNKERVIFTEGAATVALDKNIEEVVAKGDINLKILLPENTWVGWRCVINLSETEFLESIDVGRNDGAMFGNDFPSSLFEVGKTFIIAKIANAETETPSLYTLYEVDNKTRQVV